MGKRQIMRAYGCFYGRGILQHFGGVSQKGIREIVGAKDSAERPSSARYRSLLTDPNCVRVMFDFDENLS